MRFGYDVRPDEFDRLPLRPPRPLSNPGGRTHPSPPADGQEGAALAAWVIASLLGVALGLALAKYSQAWAWDALHPGRCWAP